MKHIDKLFKDRLFNHEANVPEGMWDKIAPALEEDKGRSVFWFWFTGGAIAILLAGLSYLLLNNTDANGNIIPLVENEVANTPTLPESMKSLPIETETNTTSQDDTKETETQNTPPTIPTTVKTGLKKNSTPTATQKKSSTQETPQKSTSENKSLLNQATLSTSSTVESISSVNNDLKYGKPANLVITKSYISEKGSLIEQSNVSNDTEIKEPSYNVFINSEGLNAGALLRIVEPLEILPMPKMKMVKKKRIPALSNI